MSYPVDINDLAERAHKNATNKGFWKDVNLDLAVPKHLMLAVSELSEAMEVHRNLKQEDYTIPTTQLLWVDDDGKPGGFGIELADTIIRILDLAEAHGINIQQCIFDKMSFNESRPYMHNLRY
jgi:hypothetical protein